MGGFDAKVFKRFRKCEVSVSIPERVWGVLMPGEQGLLRVFEIGVSIPERVWGVLMQQPAGYAAVVLIVSIPERVWGVLMQKSRW